MTHILIKKSSHNIIGFELEGHSGYGVEGEDIVCAGLSCIAQTTCLGLLMVAEVQVDMERDEVRGYLRCDLPKGLDGEQLHDCQVILNTAFLGFSDLRDGYSDFIELEVEEYVY